MATSPLARDINSGPIQVTIADVDHPSNRTHNGPAAYDTIGDLPITQNNRTAPQTSLVISRKSDALLFRS